MSHTLLGVRRAGMLLVSRGMMRLEGFRMAGPLPKLTVEEYLEIEREAEYKSVYYRGEMFAMPGGRQSTRSWGARM